jgi:hypothetical protein
VASELHAHPHELLQLWRARPSLLQQADAKQRLAQHVRGEFLLYIFSSYMARRHWQLIGSPELLLHPSIASDPASN